MGQNFFGLPSPKSPTFARDISERTKDLLRQVRFISSEVPYEQAWRMPVEYRRFWIDEMIAEAQKKNTQDEGWASKQAVMSPPDRVVPKR